MYIRGVNFWESSSYSNAAKGVLFRQAVLTTQFEFLTLLFIHLCLSVFFGVFCVFCCCTKEEGFAALLLSIEIGPKVTYEKLAPYAIPLPGECVCLVQKKTTQKPDFPTNKQRLSRAKAPFSRYWLASSLRSLGRRNRKKSLWGLLVNLNTLYIRICKA